MNKAIRNKCVICGNLTRLYYPSQIKQGKGKYCTRKCFSQYLEVLYKGRKPSPESIRKGIATREKTYALHPERRPRYWLGKQRSEETKRKLSQAFLGKPLLEETKRKISISVSLATKGKPRLSQRGANHVNWKGGVTPANEKARRTLEYRAWRQSVYERDNYTCTKCGVRGGRLHADHIKPFALYPELRLELGNGRTLCVDCHRKTDTWGHRTLKRVLSK